MNTTLKYIIGLIIIIAAAVGIWFAVMARQQSVPADVTMNTDARMLCYVWKTGAGDKATLKMNFTGTNGTDVTGSFDFVPAEKDSKKGTFAGVASAMDPMTSSRTADVIWNTMGEGMIAREQLFIRFGEGTAAAGFGEMRQNTDGVWVYANPAAISYAPTMQQVDCSDSAL